MLQPYLFSGDRRLVADLAGPGPDRVSAVVIDWERRGKQQRQAGARQQIGIDTQINGDGPEDLTEVAAMTDLPVLCRINAWSPASRDEMETAIACGATEILMPMVRTAGEVGEALEAARGRVGVGIMVETTDAVRVADRLAELPITRAYLGLMDLALERGSPSIFDAVADGTVERVRSAFDVPFGFAGLTVPSAGNPVPARLLAGEMTRLACGFSFLRRSFIRDVGEAPVPGLRSVRDMLGELAARDAVEVAHDRQSLREILESGLHRGEPAAVAR